MPSGEDSGPEGGGQERTSDDHVSALRSARTCAQAEVPSPL